MNPTISVVIPALNEQNYLPLLLEDLTNQTDKNFEVFVVDAKSKDDTKKVALAFSNKLQVTVLTSEKRNISYQRNLGAKYAKGEYLFFLDADSRINNNVIAKTREHIIKQKKSLYLPYPAPDRNTFFYKTLFWFCIAYVTTLHKIKKALSFGPAIVITKELFNKIGKFDELAYVSEDHNLIIKAAKAGVRVTFMPDVFVIFSMRRFREKGMVKVLLQYAVFSLMTLKNGVVYHRTITYEMGGNQYKKEKR